jgi:hypothetical protein
MVASAALASLDKGSSVQSMMCNSHCLIRKGPPNIDGEPATFHYQRIPQRLPGYQ